MTDEFDLIARYFAPLSSKIGDDCAILAPEPGERIATSTDTLVEGTHFHSDAPPDQVAFRAVVSALSDLAAMGAKPRALTLALTLPEADDTFLQQFSRGVQQAVEAHDVELIGGDTTRGHFTITCTVMGALPEDRALTRAGAQPGDYLFISGTPGDAAAALTVIDGTWPGHGQHKEYLLQRFYRPTPRLALGMELLEIASSAIDVSDGVLADAGHLCEQSGVGIRVDADLLPLSPALESVPGESQVLGWALAGGDDYELLFTVPPALAERVPAGCTRIGEVVEGDAVICEVDVGEAGYRHFGTASAPDVDVRHEDREPAAGPRAFDTIHQFLAFGFGSGLSPKAPGTAGTLVAIPLYLMASGLELPFYSILVLLAAGVGIYLCDVASRELGVHDHPGIVWDEFVGFWLTMWAVPMHWQTVVAGFVLFRLFDIAKPWPIRMLDKRVGGGFGIMIDDLLAGAVSCLLLHAGWYAWTGSWPLGPA